MDKSFTRSLTASFAGPSCANKDRALPPMGSVDLLLRGHAGIGRVAAGASMKWTYRAVLTARAPLPSGTMRLDIKTAFISPTLTGR
jgi:hypothetical protein